MLSGIFGEYLHWILGLLSRRMIYSACGLAYSLFKISCWLSKCGKDICNPQMDVDFSQCLSESRHCAGCGQLLQPFSSVEDGSAVEHWAVRCVHSVAVIWHIWCQFGKPLKVHGLPLACFQLWFH